MESLVSSKETVFSNILFAGELKVAPELSSGAANCTPNVYPVDE